MNHAEKREFGTGGCVNEMGTTPITGNFYAIQAYADTVFASLADASATGDAVTNLPAGMTIFGDFTAFTLTSGSVRAYLQPR